MQTVLLNTIRILSQVWVNETSSESWDVLNHWTSEWELCKIRGFSMLYRFWHKRDNSNTLVPRSLATALIGCHNEKIENVQDIHVSIAHSLELIPTFQPVLWMSHTCSHEIREWFKHWGWVAQQGLQHDLNNASGRLCNLDLERTERPHRHDWPIVICKLSWDEKGVSFAIIMLQKSLTDGVWLPRRETKNFNFSSGKLAIVGPTHIPHKIGKKDLLKLCTESNWGLHL